MLIYELLLEDLGNLTQLNVGPMIDILKQAHSTGGGHGRRSGPHIDAIANKFANSHSTQIGTTSEVSDFIPLKDGFKSLRDAFKKATNADKNPLGFALYIDQKAIAFAVTDYEQLRGGSRITKMAYDFTPFETIIRKKEDEEHAVRPKYYRDDSGPRREKLKTDKEVEPEYWGYGKSPEEQAAEKAKEKPKRYRGDVFTTDSINGILTKIQGYASELGGKLSIKLVFGDKQAGDKRRQRYSNPPSPRFDRKIGWDSESEAFKDLKRRLAIYKNQKKPTVDTIEKFIQVSLTHPGKTIRFDGLTYKLTASTYDKIDPLQLLRGATFKTQYNAIDPDASYSSSITLTYRFDQETNQLVPIKAEWYEKSEDGTRKNKLAVLDPVGYTKSVLNIKSLKKEEVIKGLLTKMKDSKFDNVLGISQVLKKMGMDWPELDTIERSAQHEIDNKNKK